MVGPRAGSTFSFFGSDVLRSPDCCCLQLSELLRSELKQKKGIRICKWRRLITFWFYQKAQDISAVMLKKNSWLDWRGSRLTHPDWLSKCAHQANLVVGPLFGSLNQLGKKSERTCIMQWFLLREFPNNFLGLNYGRITVMFKKMEIIQLLYLDIQINEQ